MAWLDAVDGMVRGGTPTAIRTTEASPYSLLIVAVPERFRRFEVRLDFAPRGPDDSPETWRQDSLQPNTSGELVLLLPTELLQRGPARVSVLANSNDGPIHLLEQELYPNRTENP